MAISTDSIIHYTDNIKTLSLILKEGFRLEYCLEILHMGQESSYAAHPMLSFCDIPLSNSAQHFDAYGKYGIGLSKKWAVANGVNPVLYLDKNSLIARSIAELIIERRSNKTNLTDKQKREILQIKSYAKNYSGLLKRKSVNNQNYRFYDEREWRLVPEAKDMNKAPFSISGKTYKSDKKKYNDKVKDCRFMFSADDISYIIVQYTSEIPTIVNFLRDTYSDKCTANQLDVLFSKVCSTEQILADY